MQEAIATADPLQQPTLDAVIEELGQMPVGTGVVDSPSELEAISSTLPSA